MRIEIVIFDGFDDLDALAPAEVLNIAAREGAPFDVELVGVHSPGLVQSAWKTQIFVENVLGKPDAVIIPGGGWVAKPAHGTWAQVQDGFLPRKLAEIAPGLQWAGSVSTGAMVLAAAGMLHGRAATASQGVLEEVPCDRQQKEGARDEPLSGGAAAANAVCPGPLGTQVGRGAAGPFLR